jgi:hypothetical protein
MSEEFFRIPDDRRGAYPNPGAAEALVDHERRFRRLIGKVGAGHYERMALGEITGEMEESNRRSVEARRMVDEVASVKPTEARKGRFDWAGDAPSPLDTTRASLDALSPVMERAVAAVEGRALPLGVSCPDCEGRAEPVCISVPIGDGVNELDMMRALEFVVRYFAGDLPASFPTDRRIPPGASRRAVKWLAERYGGEA